MSSNSKGPGYHVVYCRYIVKNGVKIYPKKSKVFRIYVKDNKAA